MMQMNNSSVFIDSVESMCYGPRDSNTFTAVAELVLFIFSLLSLGYVVGYSTGHWHATKSHQPSETTREENELYVNARFLNAMQTPPSV